MNIAIFGATSVIAKEYVQEALINSYDNFFLFSRSLNEINAWIEAMKSDQCRLYARTYEEFSVSTKFDAIINFIGRGDPKRLKQDHNNFLLINDYFDNKILHYLLDQPTTKYIYISSGASYLNSFDNPIRHDDLENVDLNRLRSFDLYSVSKRLSEIKHRKLEHLNIVDLRIFSYVQWLDILHEGSLLGLIFSSIKNGKEFKTNNIEIYRDYINSKMFFDAINCILNVDALNCSLDLYSKKPASKFEILQTLAEEFDLKFSINQTLNLEDFNITGLKKNYFSNNREIAKFGYIPSRSSIDIIKEQALKMFKA